MKTVKLSPEDEARLRALMESESALYSELGRIREDFLLRERELVQKLQSTRDEGAVYLGILGRHYIDGAVRGWVFRPDQMAFVSTIEEESDVQGRES